MMTIIFLWPGCSTCSSKTSPRSYHGVPWGPSWNMNKSTCRGGIDEINIGAAMIKFHLMDYYWYCRETRMRCYAQTHQIDLQCNRRGKGPAKTWIRSIQCTLTYQGTTHFRQNIFSKCISADAYHVFCNQWEEKKIKSSSGIPEWGYSNVSNKWDRFQYTRSLIIEG